jgi:hypothetical protein
MAVRYKYPPSSVTEITLTPETNITLTPETNITLTPETNNINSEAYCTVTAATINIFLTYPCYLVG